MPTDAPDPVTVDAHLDRVLHQVRPLQPYHQPLLGAHDLAVCEDVVSEVDLPSFDNSAMDGYAVCLDDVAAATEADPVALPVVGEAAAGQSSLLAQTPGTAVRIMTGAAVPQGADAVVPLEWTDAGVATVRIGRAPKSGQHIRRRGEDLQAGDPLLSDGTVMGPRQLGLLAAVGRSQVRARPRPRVVVISTGSELREPGSPLGGDAVYDSNSYMLAACAHAHGAIAYRVGVVSDDPHEFTDVLGDQLVRADLVVTSGGVSKGQYDVVKETLGEQGTIWFGEVAMQPGKPQGFGVVGEDDTPIFTLPGNPVSAYVSFEVFVAPALRRMLGRLPYRRPTVTATATEGFASAVGKRQFVRARYEVDHTGAHVIRVGGHGSHLMGNLSQSNALIVVDEDTDIVTAGDQVPVLVLDREF